MGRVEHRHLPFEAVDRPVDERLFEEEGGVVGEVAGREVVGPVQDHVVVLEDVEDVAGVEVLADSDDLDVGVHRLHPIRGGLDLVPAQVFKSVVASTAYFWPGTEFQAMVKGRPGRSAAPDMVSGLQSGSIPLASLVLAQIQPLTAPPGQRLPSRSKCRCLGSMASNGTSITWG